MAEASIPSSSNTFTISEAQYEQLLTYVPSGVIGSYGDTAIITADGTTREIIVKASKAGLVQAYRWDSGAADVRKPIAANSSGSTRLDLVVLRLTKTTPWAVTTVVITGTPGSGVAPTPTQDAGITGVWELPLAVVTVANGATTIAAVDVASKEVYLGRAPLVGAAANIPTAPEGALAWSADTDTLSARDGTTWRPVATSGRCTATRSAVQTITNNSNTDVSFDTEVLDTHGFFAPTATSLIIPAGMGGIYSVSGWCQWIASSTGWRRLAISKSGGTTAGTDSWHVLVPTPGVSADCGQSIEVNDVSLAAGDFIRLHVWHTQGSSIDLLKARVSLRRLPS